MDFQALVTEDILYAVVILAYVLISGFTFWLPLKRLLRSDRLALALTVPVSISIQIIVGYLLYLVNNPAAYIWVYLLIVATFNIILALSPPLRPRSEASCHCRRSAGNCPAGPVLLRFIVFRSPRQSRHNVSYPLLTGD
jgi:cation transport ATPase